MSLPQSRFVFPVFMIYFCLLTANTAHADLILFPTGFGRGAITVADQGPGDLYGAPNQQQIIGLRTPVGGARIPIPLGGAGGATFSGDLLGTNLKFGVGFPGINLLGNWTITAGPAGVDTGPNWVALASLDYSRGLELGLSSITEIFTNFSTTLASSEPEGPLVGGERFGLGAFATTFTSQPGDIAKSFWVDPGNTAGQIIVDPLAPNTNPTNLTGVYKPGNGIFYLLASFKLGPNEQFGGGVGNGQPCALDNCGEFIRVVPEPSSIVLFSGGLTLMFLMLNACRSKRNTPAQ